MKDSEGVMCDVDEARVTKKKIKKKKMPGQVEDPMFDLMSQT